jgi:hypothetical protein
MPASRLPVLLTIVLSLPLLGQVAAVETFEAEGWRVAAFFSDPTGSFERSNPGIRQRTPREQAEAWVVTLQNRAIYHFSATRVATGRRLHFVVRGDPSVKDSAAFYRLEIVDGARLPVLDPNRDDYAGAVLSRSPFPAVRGELFEHLFPASSRARVAGNGVQLFPGIYARVNRYADLRDGFLKALKAVPPAD